MHILVEGSMVQHYKGGLYEILHFGLNEADLAEVVIYKSLKDGKVWVRPKSSFFSKVVVAGEEVERFKAL